MFGSEGRGGEGNGGALEDINMFSPDFDCYISGGHAPLPSPLHYRDRQVSMSAF